ARLRRGDDRRKTIENKIAGAFLFVELLNKVMRNRDVNQLTVPLHCVVGVVAEKCFGANKLFKVLIRPAVYGDNLVAGFQTNRLPYRANLKSAVFINHILQQIGIAVRVRDTYTDDITYFFTDANTAQNNTNSLTVPL